MRLRIAQSLDPFGLEEQRPARAETPKQIVEPRTGADQLGFGGAFEVRPAEAEASLETAILVEDHAVRHQGSGGSGGGGHSGRQRQGR